MAARKRTSHRGRCRLWGHPLLVAEALERRQLLAAVTVNAKQVIRTTNGNLAGTNFAYWQYEQNSTQMRQMIQAAGLKIFRIGGGSAVDDNEHFNSPSPYNGYQTLPISANVVQAVGGDAIVTVNYGTGSPQEAAAEVAYLNARVGDTTPIGAGPQWSTATSTWVSVDWRTAGYWAALRAAAPLATDDGLNVLRVSHPTPWGFGSFEVGNEEYATWETDKHGSGGGAPHDPATYAAFAATFNTLAQQISPGVRVGIDATVPLKYNLPDQTWTADVLSRAAALGFVPAFLSDHTYITGLSDQNLLLHSVDDPAFINGDGVASSWASRASYYRNLITAAFGATTGASVQLMETEFNADIGNKQSVSLVNGLWVADAVGGLAQTEYAAALGWDLTNGYGALAADPTHYGWREGSDDGFISTGSANGATSGAYVPYPTYFADQLLSKVYQPQAQVIAATSSDPNLDAFAALEPNGHLALMVVNKSQAGLTNATTGTPATIAATFTFAGFIPSAQATQWQYGSAQDNAQKASATGAASLATSTPSLAVSGSSFSLAFPSYSMSVLDLTPRAAPTVATAAAVASNPVTGTTAAVTVLGADSAGESNLTYAWSATGPAAVGFSATGTNAAKAATATFALAGTYTVTATITNSAGLTTTSSVAVTVAQTPTAVVVSPVGTSVVAAGTTRGMSAAVTDQFGQPIAAPSVAWSTSAGTVTAAGVFTADPAAAAPTVTVTATAGGAVGHATLSIVPVTYATVDGFYLRLASDGVTEQVWTGVPGSVGPSFAATPTYAIRWADLPALTVGPGTANTAGSLTIDASNGNPIPAGGLSFDGGGGADALNVLGSTGGDAVTLGGNQVGFGTGPAVTLANVEAIRLTLGAGADTLTQSAQPVAAVTWTDPTSSDTLAIAGGTFTLPAPTAAATQVALATVSVAAGARLALASASPNRSLLTLSAEPTLAGMLDVGGNDLLVHGGDLSALTALAATGYAGGAWTGLGLASAAAAADAAHVTALGVAALPPGTPVDGQPVVATDVVVKFTRYGDGNLDGVVNVADYTRIDAGYVAHGSLTGWANGDFNYDGAIDGSDYALIDNAFNTQPPANNTAARVTPETAASSVRPGPADRRHRPATGQHRHPAHAPVRRLDGPRVAPASRQTG